MISYGFMVYCSIGDMRRGPKGFYHCMLFLYVFIHRHIMSVKCDPENVINEQLSLYKTDLIITEHNYKRGTNKNIQKQHTVVLD